MPFVESYGILSAITETTVTVTLKSVTEKELTSKDFKVTANDKTVTVKSIEKVDSDLTGKTYTLTVESLAKKEGTLTVNGVTKAFDFKAAEVTGISVKDANHVVVNFNEELNEDSITAQRFTVKKVNGTALTTSMVVLNADKSSVTISTTEKLVPADYVLVLGNGTDKVEDKAGNGIFVGTEISFRPTADEIESTSAPNLAKATYNKGTGILSLTFDKNVEDSKFDLTKISLAGTALTASDTLNTVLSNDNFVQVQLSNATMKLVNAHTGELTLKAEKGAYGTSTTLTNGETFNVLKEEPAVIEAVAYNEETKMLKVTFDMPVTLEHDTVLSLDDADELGSVNITKSMTKEDTTVASKTWNFDCTSVHTDIKALTTKNVKAYIAAAAVKNEAKVLNAAQQDTYKKGLSVSYTKDETKPFITGVEYNNDKKKLTVKFSEKVTLEAGNFVIDTEETDSDSTRAIIANTKFTGHDIASDKFVADLSSETTIANALEKLYNENGNTLKLTVAKNIIKDTNNLVNDEVKFADGINVVFNDYVKPTVSAPVAESNNKIKVVFNEKVQKETAENIANYVIKDNTAASLAVTKAELQNDGKTVYLTTASQVADKPYTLTVSNVKDLQSNIINTISQEFDGNGEVKDAKLEVTAIEATTVENGRDTIKVTFSEVVDQTAAAKLANYAVLAKGTRDDYKDAKAVSLKNASIKVDSTNTKEVIITLADDVKMITGNEYKVITSNITDIYGNELDSTKVSKKEAATGDSTLVAPKVIFNMLDGDKNDTVSLIFNEKLNAEKLVKENFKIEDATITSLSSSWDSDKNKLTVTLHTANDFDAAKKVIIDEAIVDLAGNSIPLGEREILASAAVIEDATKPTITKVEAKTVSGAADTIKVTFSKDVLKASAEVLENYTLVDENGNKIDLTDAEVEYNSKVATITLPYGLGPDKNTVKLLNDKNYVVTTSNVIDVKGNKMNSVSKVVTWDPASDKTAPTYTVTPSAGSNTVTIQFNEAVDLSKVDISTFVVKYDSDNTVDTNNIETLDVIYTVVNKNNNTVTLTLKSNLAATGTHANDEIIVTITDGQEITDLAGNKASHDSVKADV